MEKNICLRDRRAIPKNHLPPPQRAASPDHDPILFFSGWRFSDMMTIAPENLQCEIPPFKPSSTESRHVIGLFGFAFLAGRTFKDIHPGKINACDVLTNPQL